jgi:formiminotetrahydrofolate cyclodeaminase
MEGELCHLPLIELTDQLAARTPAPGGGSAIAVACALAAGLVEMAAAFSPRAEPAEPAEPADPAGARARVLRVQALSLAEQELESYRPVLEALAIPKGQPGRSEQLSAARSTASEAPFKLAETGAELAELAAEAARTGSPHLAGDAIAAALLAEAACRAATQLVAINLSDRDDDPRLQQAGRLARRAAAARNLVLASDF